MIVLDASVVVEVLTNRALADTIREAMAGSDDEFIAPYLIDIEVVHVVRRLAAAGQIERVRARRILAELADLPIARFEHVPLLRRIWELRHNLSAYDATYVALAEATSATLFTMDRKLAEGHRARVEIFA